MEPECLNSLSSLCGGTFQLDVAAFKINSFDNVARHRADFRSSRVAQRCSWAPPDTQAGCNRCGSGVLQTRPGNGKRPPRDLRCTCHHSCMDSARKDCSRSHKAGLGNEERRRTKQAQNCENVIKSTWRYQTKMVSSSQRAEFASPLQ